MQNCAKQTCQAAVSVHVINYYKPSFPYFCATIEYRLHVETHNYQPMSELLRYYTLTQPHLYQAVWFCFSQLHISLFIISIVTQSEFLRAYFFCFRVGFWIMSGAYLHKPQNVWHKAAGHSWRCIDQVQLILHALELLPSTIHAAAFAFMKLICLVSVVLNLV